MKRYMGNPSRKNENAQNPSCAIINAGNRIIQATETYHGTLPLHFIGRNNRSKPISKESVSQVIELLGYKGRATGHGFRHSMSTILHEQGFDSARIEMQLAHVDKNNIRGTYNHAQYIEKEDICCSGMLTEYFPLSKTPL